ncbi:MAG TPA: hypothetical protein VE964_12770 [Myxococcales bacterium]|nr:hypothetical protein [Myxococcales bacterium]
MIRKVLGIDLASSKWSSVGSATVEFDGRAARFTRVVPGAIAWPATELTPGALADAIDQFARREGVCAVALDGPQGWRDPATPDDTPGVGRRCEFECRTQGKTGIHPRTFPGTQRGWIEFCVDVFAHLLGKPGVALADPAGCAAGPGAYVILECFPTSAWRSSGLRALPAKGKKPDLAQFLRALSAPYSLPRARVQSHDDLQALVAALSAAAVAGGPATALPRGAPAKVIAPPSGSQLRVEGYIWDVQPIRSRPKTPRWT